MTQQRQQGVALVVSMLLLVAITLLVITSMRNSGMQERMTANLAERNMSFQLVEATLNFVQNAVNNVDPTTLCNVQTGYYCQPVPGQADRWINPATVWGSDGPEYEAVGRAQYIAEYMGQWVDTATATCAVAGQLEVPEDCIKDTWRITARTTSNDGAAVMLQVIFRLR